MNKKLLYESIKCTSLRVKEEEKKSLKVQRKRKEKIKKKKKTKNKEINYLSIKENNSFFLSTPPKW